MSTLLNNECNDRVNNQLARWATAVSRDEDKEVVPANTDKAGLKAKEAQWSHVH